MATTRFLFSNLPAELRNEVYTYLSQHTDSSTAYTNSIPLKTKTYSCKHTTITLQPVHHGAPELLNLARWNVAEANEYRAWLLENGIQIRIAVVFTGRVNTFVQADWNKRVAAHLRKLQRNHPWLCKVAAYDVRIVWGAVDMPLVSSRKKMMEQKRTAGQIVHDMATALAQMMSENVKRRRGEARIRLCLERWMASQTAFSAIKLCLRDFLDAVKGFEGFQRVEKEVWVAPLTKTEDEIRTFPLAALPRANTRDWFQFGEKLDKWEDCNLGHLVGEGITAEDKAGEVKDNVLNLLAQECRGF
jgi:hypothetical protein